MTHTRVRSLILFDYSMNVALETVHEFKNLGVKFDKEGPSMSILV